MTPTIRPARPDEAGLLTALALRSKAHWGYDETFMMACAAELTVSADAIRRNPTHVVEEGSRVLGFYMLEVVSRDEVELEFLFVEPAAIGKGHGRLLIEHARGVAAAAGHTVVIIQGDPNADRFYRAAGGVPTGSRPSASVPGRVLPVYRIDLGR